MEYGYFHPSRGYWQTTGQPSADVLATYPEGTSQIPLKPGAGTEWDGAAWVPSAPVAPEVPQIVTMRQARLALFGAGLLSGVEAAIEALPEPQRTAARIEWDYSSEVHRTRPFVQTLAGALNLTPEQLDALVTQAAQL